MSRNRDLGVNGKLHEKSVQSDHVTVFIPYTQIYLYHKTNNLYTYNIQVYIAKLN